jgi:hypothetical protein
MSYFDLNGVLDVQKNYLNDLNALRQTDNSNVQINVSNWSSALNTNLDSLATSYESADPAIQTVLTKQSDVNNILYNEQQRLNAKKTQMDQAIQTQNRMIQLNDSYRKRTAQYTYIFTIIILGLLIYVVLVKLPGFVSIPEGIIDLLAVLVFGIIGIVVWKLWASIQARDPLDFDRLHTTSIPVAGNAVVTSMQSDVETGDLSGLVTSSSTCKGEQCCDTTTQSWNSSVGRCLPLESTTCGKYYWDLTAGHCTNSDTDSSGNTLAPGVCPTDMSLCGNVCVPSGTTCYYNPKSVSSEAFSAYEYNDYGKYN